MKAVTYSLRLFSLFFLNHLFYMPIDLFRQEGLHAPFIEAYPFPAPFARVFPSHDQAIPRDRTDLDFTGRAEYSDKPGIDGTG